MNRNKQTITIDKEQAFVIALALQRLNDVFDIGLSYATLITDDKKKINYLLTLLQRSVTADLLLIEINDRFNLTEKK